MLKCGTDSLENGNAEEKKGAEVQMEGCRREEKGDDFDRSKKNSAERPGVGI